MALAMAIRWRCPPESFDALSPTTVSYPSGNPLTNSWACACRAAFSISAGVAEGLPLGDIFPDRSSEQ